MKDPADNEQTIIKTPQPLTPDTPLHKTAGSFVERTHALTDEGRYDEALTEIGTAINLYGQREDLVVEQERITDEYTHRLMKDAEVYKNEGNFETAMELLLTARRLQPANTHVQSAINVINILIDDEKKSRRRRIMAVVAGCLLIVAFAVAGYCYHYVYIEGKQYDKLMKSPSIENCRIYLKNYPNGRHADEVKSRLNMLEEDADEWNICTRWDNVQAYLNFIENHPGSPYNERAEERIDQKLWRAAVSSKSNADYRYYIKMCPDGRHVDDARRYIKQNDDNDYNPNWD